LNTEIPFGGHTVPISIVGAKLAAKKAQKKREKKHNLTSDEKQHTVAQAQLNNIGVMPF